jgi:glycosyltransferase involved in cell wall biosynthesis
MRPRIAIFVSSLGVRGRERVLLEVARELVARESAVDFLTPLPSDSLRDALPAGVELVDLDRWWMRPPGIHLRNKGRIYLSPPALISYLRRARPDVLLAGSIPPSLAALTARRLARGETRVVLRQSNVVHIGSSSRWRDVRRRPRDVWIPRLYRRADAIIAVSDGVADNISALTGLTRERIHVVPNRNVPDDLARRVAEPVDHPWFQPGGPPVVLAVGRFVEKKDYPTLLRAIRRLRDERPVRLAILGRDGPERPAVEARIRELGLQDDVEILGFRDNPFAYMARADAFALSSVSEGMPNALVEALACGCPAVSTDCPSGPSEILAGGDYGPLVRVGDDSGLCDALRSLLDHPPDRERLRARGAEYGIAGAVTAYVDILLDAQARRAAKIA